MLALSDLSLFNATVVRYSFFLALDEQRGASHAYEVLKDRAVNE